MKSKLIMGDVRPGDVLHYHNQLFLVVEGPLKEEEYESDIFKIFNLTHDRREKIYTHNSYYVLDNYQDITLGPR